LSSVDAKAESEGGIMVMTRWWVALTLSEAGLEFFRRRKDVLCSSPAPAIFRPKGNFLARALFLLKEGRRRCDDQSAKDIAFNGALRTVIVRDALANSTQEKG
jgi:hypothetical protein